MLTGVFRRKQNKTKKPPNKPKTNTHLPCKKPQPTNQKTQQKPPSPSLLSQLCHVGKIHCVPGWSQILSLQVILFMDLQKQVVQENMKNIE